eukprot:CAMPEP_0174347026 /NCGR_PEP_ID=MMETSP0811_2-20130205/2952_1 /TAXON_ID=73025 ORGANISM="Eutreptiella gymnastica-like, Strain CCMP1594" /NCGR_SAMPLE_ID=MMETSP0811_2 /ASSEMBLY_ACC=CAM_ASM_000667 /LENGTH=64 /DNA_ID=CAMNT_0015472173 /DNA_START=479 /DNA_END=673 /DNA_ORIENTATION=-
MALLRRVAGVPMGLGAGRLLEAAHPAHSQCSMPGPVGTGGALPRKPIPGAQAANQRPRAQGLCS